MEKEQAIQGNTEKNATKKVVGDPGGWVIQLERLFLVALGVELGYLFDFFLVS